MKSINQNNSIPCSVFKDLIPSYVENLTAEETKRQMDAHLVECTKCQERIAEYREELEAEEIENLNLSFKMKKAFVRKKYQLLGIVSGFALIVCLLIGGYFASIQINDAVNNITYDTTSTLDYGNMKHYYGLSKLKLFPPRERIQNEGKILEYKCKLNGKVYQDCVIFLKCKYQDAAYDNEIERLKEVKGDNSMKSVYTTTDYPYPAVYAMKNTEGCNEYALLLEEENSIVYVYLQGFHDRRTLIFSEDYLPNDYGQDGFPYEEVNEYNIYEGEPK